MAQNQEIRLTTCDPDITNVILSTPTGFEFAQERKEQSIDVVQIDPLTTQTTIKTVITRKTGLNDKFNNG